MCTAPICDGRPPSATGARRAPQGQRLAGPRGVALRPPRPAPGLPHRARRRDHGHARSAEEPGRARAQARWSAPRRSGCSSAGSRSSCCQLAVECAAQTHGHPTALPLRGRATPSSCTALARGESPRRLRAAGAGPAGRAPRPPARHGRRCKHALGAVRQGMPTPARVETSLGDGHGGGGPRRRRVLRAGRRGRTARAAAGREPRRPLRRPPAR